MNYAETVDSIEKWQKSSQTLGQGDHAVTVWKVRSDEDAERDADIIRRAHMSKTFRKELIPDAVVEAAASIARQSGRYDIPNQASLHSNPSLFGGNNYPLTGLHADTHLEDSKPKSAAYKTLYVADGIVKAYFKLLPVKFLNSSPDEMDEMLGNRAIPNPKSVTGMSMAVGIEDEYVAVHAPAGTIMAFTAAGNPNLGVAAAEHEIRSVTESRITIPLEDYLFRTTIRGVGKVA